MLKNIGIFLVSLILLTGCGGGGSSSGSGTSSFTGSSYKGIITSAVVEVYDFSNNTKGELISEGTVSNSELDLPDANYSNKVLLEIKKDDENTASYIDEDSGDSILFNDLVLKMIIDNFDESENYVATALTTIATELVLEGVISDITTSYETVSKLFGLSFKNLNIIKPNIEGLSTDSENSTENEYALSLLSLVALQNEIGTQTGNDFTIKDLIDLIKQDLRDGIFDGKENDVDLTVNNGSTSLNIGDIPTKLSKAGSRSLSEKNPNLLNNMKGFFLRVTTASRAIEAPSVEIKANNVIKINEKTIFSADGSKSPFSYPLTYSWSIKSSPINATVVFSSKTSSNTFITVDLEGNYIISLEVSDGQNRVSKDFSFIADLDGDGLLGSDDLDRDGDGILNTDDKFPDNPAEFLDTNSDDTGNFSQKDEDGDSVIDINDEYPFDNTKSQITVYNETEFNGNINDANVLTGTLPFKISAVVNANGSDDDYFKFTSTAGSIISAKITKTFSDFEPIISLVDSSGNPISSILTINDVDSSIITFRIPINGTFALIVTDKNSKSDARNIYTLTIFEDSDIDGVSNEFERAIGSNEDSSDTDGDGIKDYYEINTESFDIDSDGIPNWLDNDSDNDTLEDSQESLTDYDNDGVLNPFDTDSDGNSILDSDEIGSNTNNPLNTDGDEYPDYMDLDDDNDGILDVNDDSRLVAAEIDASSTIYVKGIIDSKEINSFAQSEGSIKIDGENFTSEAIVILVDSTGVYNITPTDITINTITLDLPNIEGRSEIRVYDDSVLTTSANINIVNTTDPVIYDISYPNSQTYALEGDTITINGSNLLNVTSVIINGLTVNVNSSTSNTISFIVDSSLSSGNLIASTLNDSSNTLSIFVGRQVAGTVILPENSAYTFDELKVKFTGVESNINNDGTFDIIVKNNSSSSVTIFTPETPNKNVALYLSSIVLSDNDNIIIDSNSTAIDIMFSAFGAESAEIDRKKSIYNVIESNIDIFSNNLEENLGLNPYYIAESSDGYINSLSSSKDIIKTLLKDNSLIRNLSISSISRSKLVNEISGFSVYKYGDPIDGTIEIQNDTMIFADYMITDLSNGKTIKSYTNKYYDENLLGPQYSGFFLYWASDKIHNLKFQSSQVNIISPKFKGMTLNNFNKLPEYKLALRTLLSQGILPIVGAVIPIPGNGNDCEKSFLNGILIKAIDEAVVRGFAQGEVTKGLIAYAESLIGVFRDEAIKTILKETLVGCLYAGATDADIAKKLGGDVINEYIAKLSTKLASFALPTKAVQYGGLVADLGWTVFDFATIPDKLTFNINFPITIKDMYPTSIKKNGSDKIIVLDATGLEIYCSNYDNQWIDDTFFPPRYNNVCVSWHYPTVELSSGTEKLELDLNKRMDEQYIFEIPNSFIESAENEISVKVKHVHNDEQDIDELIDIEVDAPTVISIVDKLEITNISPDTGSTGTTVTVSGAGFSTNLSENDVYFTTSSGSLKANIIEVSESELKVSVPLGTITGNVWVQVDNEESNKLQFTVNTTQLTINFGDNGSANDDTFSLELNGQTIKTMTTPVRTASGIVELTSGQIYTVSLKGITAPDDVGTYYISFPSEIEVLSGDSLSGGDLTAGVVKSWQVQLNSNISITRSINSSIKYDVSRQVILQPE